jgi:DnaJ-class molecular chaperone
MSPGVDPGPDHYQVLGVKPGASADEIKRAYRRLARQYHPDRTGGDKAKETRFKQISAAYDVLGDAARRSQYDAVRAGAPFGGAGFGGAGSSGFWDLGDLFSQFFSGAGKDDGPRVEYRVYGDGSVPDGFPEGFTDTPFDMPKGPGRRENRRAGTPASTERKVRTSDGTVLLQRGDDVYSDVRLALDEAVLGAVKEVSTLTGKAKVRIPPGTPSGVKLRLKGKGARGARGRGDHFVTVQIDVPRDIDEEAQRLLVQFMQRAGKQKSGKE